MKLMRWFLLATATLAVGVGSVANAAVITSLDHDGSDSYAVLAGAVGEARSQNGVDMTFGAVWNTDTLTPGTNGTLIQFKRTLNDSFGIGLYFRDATNAVCLAYNLGTDACCGTIVADTWYFSAGVYTLSDDRWTLRHFTMDGTQVCTQSFTPTTSRFDDEQAQEISVGAYESGGVILGELDGQSDLQFFLRGAAKGQSDLGAYAINPYATGDSWLGSHGTSIFKWWFDSTSTCPASVCTDATGNGVTMTLSGGTTLGVANGPDIPERAAGGGGSLLLRVVRDAD